MKPTKLLIAAALLASPALAADSGMKTGTTMGPSHHDTTGMNSPSDQMKADRMDEKKFYHADITFSPGSAALTEDQKVKLRQLVREVRGSHEIEQVTIASWSDKALPAKNAKVVDADRELAEKRADAIRDIVRLELGVNDIDAYNMAEPANWLARTFNTKDAELKSIFTRAEEAPIKREEFQLIKDSGGIGKAIVVAEYRLDDKFNTPAQTPSTTTP